MPGKRKANRAPDQRRAQSQKVAKRASQNRGVKPPVLASSDASTSEESDSSPSSGDEEPQLYTTSDRIVHLERRLKALPLSKVEEAGVISVALQALRQEQRTPTKKNKPFKFMALARAPKELAMDDPALEEWFQNVTASLLGSGGPKDEWVRAVTGQATADNTALGQIATEALARGARKGCAVHYPPRCVDRQRLSSQHTEFRLSTIRAGLTQLCVSSKRVS